jgi:hypothetical protein
MKNPELYVATGIMKYADALMRAHHVDRAMCMNHLLSLVHDQYKIELYEQTKK